MSTTPQPILGKALAAPTQVRKPWRATARTVFQALIGFASMWGLIVETLGLNETWQWVSASLVVTAAITRLMAVPAVNDWLARFLPFLAPDDPQRILGKAFVDRGDVRPGELGETGLSFVIGVFALIILVVLLFRLL